FLRRWRGSGALLFAATLCLGYLPYLGAGAALLGGVTAEGSEAIFNDGAFWLIRQLLKPLPGDPVAGARAIAALVLAGLGIWLAARPELRRGNPPLPAGEGWGEGRRSGDALTLPLSKWERERSASLSSSVVRGPWSVVRRPSSVVEGAYVLVGAVVALSAVV